MIKSSEPSTAIRFQTTVEKEVYLLPLFFLFFLSSPNLLLRKSNHYKTRDRFNVLWDDTKDGCLPEASYRNITDHVNIYIYIIYMLLSLFDQSTEENKRQYAFSLDFIGILE